MEPNFRPSQNPFLSMLVWVKFLELPVEYFNKLTLFDIAKLVGTPLRSILLLIQLAGLDMPEFILKFRFLNHSFLKFGWLMGGNKLSMKTLICCV